MGGRGMRLHSLAIPALLVLQIKDSVLGQLGVDVQVFCSCGPACDPQMPSMVQAAGG